MSKFVRLRNVELASQLKISDNFGKQALPMKILRTSVFLFFPPVLRTAYQKNSGNRFHDGHNN